MSITFNYEHCGKSLTTSDDKAGRQAKCPGCGEVIAVPERLGAFDRDSDLEDEAELDDLPTAPRVRRSESPAGVRLCPMCGAKNSRRAATCVECGESLAGADEVRSHPGDFVYAGFWLRFAALLIDNILLGCVSTVIGFGAGIAGALVLIGANNGNADALDDPAVETAFSAGGQLIGIVLSWLYFALMESSAKQATLGKMAVGIKVCDLEGRRITFGKASGRFFAKILSGLICLIGYIMAGFTEKKQALHDQLAGTLVVKS